MPHNSPITIDDLEAMALVYALKSIEPIAINKPIKVITDNSHLLHLSTWKPLNSRQKRMLAYLMQYDLSISYIPGSKNVTPDFLSRLFMDASPAERVKHAPQQIQEDEDFLFAVTTRASARRMQSISRPVDNDQAVTDAQHGVSDNSADISEELTPETDLYEDTDDERRTRDARNAELDVTPTIVAADYEDDEDSSICLSILEQAS